jgi:hypothetical protein
LPRREVIASPDEPKQIRKPNRKRKKCSLEPKKPSGTWLQGSVLTTRAKLTKAFGEPTQYEESKITLQWGIKFDDGTIATIYDWKRYELGTPAEDELITYNIGGVDLGAVRNVNDALSHKIARSLFIEGREWFDKVNGNSYFSARIWVDGGQVAILPFQYGYGSQFEYEAQKKLLELGYLPQEGKNRGLWSIAEEMGFDFYSSKS